MPIKWKILRHTNGKISILTIFLFIVSLLTSFIVVVATEQMGDSGFDPQADTYVWGSAGPGWYDATHVHTIQEGIDNATASSTVHIYAGHYIENVLVDKTVNIIGNATTNTTADGGASGSVFNVTVDWVNISRLKINNTGEGGFNLYAGVLVWANHSYIHDCNITLTDHGVFLGEVNGLVDTEYHNISNNKFYNTSYAALMGVNSNHTEVYNNSFSKVNDGITFVSSIFNNISHNNVINSINGVGITLLFSDIHGIYNNTINNSGGGIYLSLSNNSLIYQNTIEQIDESPGIYLEFSVDNLIYHNNFNNTINSFDDGGSNNWNLSYPDGGNYWANYTGIDHYSGASQNIPGSDGIGDTEYNYDIGVTDNYPLMVLYPQDANKPITKNPNPANGSTGVLLTTEIWNVTIENPNGSTFNWHIDVTNASTGYSIGSNSSTGSSNGSYFVNISGNLTYTTIYKVYVNVSGSWTNDTYNFTTQGPPSIVNLSNESPTNGSNATEMYPILSIDANDTKGNNFDLYWTTNASGSWITFNSNLSINNGTYTQIATWANTANTTYWWNVSGLSEVGTWTNKTYNFTTDEYTWGDWSEWWQFNFSADAPDSLVAETFGLSQINLTWNKGAGGDKTVVVRNATGVQSYPTTPNGGTVIYNNTGTSYDDTGLHDGMQYWYSAWSWNNTHTNFSLTYATATNTTQSNLGIWKEFPVNESTGVARPPINLSAKINGTNIDIDFYWINITPVNDVWTHIAGWNDVSGDWYIILDTALTGLSPGTQFIWGDTGYNWSINITDGTNWLNKTFTYHTTGSRYDVTNSGDVISGDVSACWANRQGQATYDGIYDVTNSGDIVSGDVSAIWMNRT